MLKKDLIDKIASLEAELKAFDSSDGRVRDNISMFLGSVEQDSYSQKVEVIRLSWAQIYFRLGKLKAEKDQAENINSLTSRVERLTHFMHHIEEKENNKLEDIKQTINPQL